MWKPFVWVLFSFLACFAVIAEGEESKGSSPYFLAPGDVLEISVWQEENLQKQALVAPDGMITFPLAGNLQAAGHSIGQLQEELKKRLSSYLSDPVVTVALLNNSGNVVFVIGKVNKPGEFPVQRRVDVLQALSMAGGFTPFADKDDIIVLRRSEDGKQQVFRFDYTDVVNGENLEQNIVLLPGDTVVVP